MKHKWKIGDRFEYVRGRWFEITKLINSYDSVYMVMYEDGSKFEIGAYLEAFTYLGNFNKSESFKTLYEKLQG